MNAPHSPSLLSKVEMAPRDPILGLTEAYNADKNPKKVQATLKAMLQMKKLDLKKLREAFDKG